MGKRKKTLEDKALEVFLLFGDERKEAPRRASRFYELWNEATTQPAAKGWTRAELEIDGMYVWLVWPSEGGRYHAIATTRQELLEALPLCFDRIAKLAEHEELALRKAITTKGSVKGIDIVQWVPFKGQKRVADVWEAIQNIYRGL